MEHLVVVVARESDGPQAMSTMDRKMDTDSKRGRKETKSFAR